MSRVDGWEERFFATIESRQNTPFVWGFDDCMGFALASIHAVTGEHPMPEIDAYHDAKQARRVLRDLGFSSLAEAFASRFEEIHPVFASRADVGVLDNLGAECAAVCIGTGFIGKAETGIIRVPRQRITRAFRI